MKKENRQPNFKKRFEKDQQLEESDQEVYLIQQHKKKYKPYKNQFNTQPLKTYSLKSWKKIPLQQLPKRVCQEINSNNNWNFQQIKQRVMNHLIHLKSRQFFNKKQDTIDLHYWFDIPARNLITRVLKLSNQRRLRPFVIQIITGRGNGSEGYEAILKPNIGRILDRYQYQYRYVFKGQQESSGMYTVSFL